MCVRIPIWTWILSIQLASLKNIVDSIQVLDRSLHTEYTNHSNVWHPYDMGNWLSFLLDKPHVPHYFLTERYRVIATCNTFAQMPPEKTVFFSLQNSPNLFSHCTSLQSYNMDTCWSFFLIKRHAPHII
jgi:hypothetical protein